MVAGATLRPITVATSDGLRGLRKCVGAKTIGRVSPSPAHTGPGLIPIGLSVAGMILTGTDRSVARVSDHEVP